MQEKQQGPNPEVIKSMFAKVANRYDQANTVLSLGIHHIWRNKVVEFSRAKFGDKVLDCATGTGDLAIEFKKAVGPTGEVTGTDFCEDMLSVAPQKAQKENLDIQFAVADVMQLPYADQQFDIASISFGIRNVANPVKGLSEMARVLKPGGTLIVLEFGQMQVPVLGSLYQFYSEKVLPKIGGWVTGQQKAYEYLQTSSAAFPCREEFVLLMKKTEQLKDIEFHSLSLGIAYIYKAKKI